MRNLAPIAILTIFLSLPALAARAAEKPHPSRGDRMVAAYFQAETAKLSQACLADVKTLDDWKAKKSIYRKQLLEMLGLDPMPARTDLKPVVTGTLTVNDPDGSAGFTVENVHFQSRPGLYVTGNLYIPRGLAAPAPAILYVCGHGGEKKDGVSLGNKTHYRHHGCWFAQHGYVCLMIDTLQMGEIEGIHHGTYREKMWWWNNRGYTPAGVEAWNCVRALDYLETRQEVDAQRLGVTGRSGGGAYSWWITAIDDRIKASAPVAGITDLENYVVDGCVEGHCDCMFMVNTYRWDYPLLAALAAPRPLLLCNTDSDRIFPLDGVVRTHASVRKIYDLYEAGDKLGLVITPGPHKDTQPLRVPVFTWMNKHLMDKTDPIKKTAEPLVTREQLRVFKHLPKDQKNTKISESFTRLAPPPALPAAAADWTKMSGTWRKALVEKCFRGWPKSPGPLNIQPAFAATHDGLCLAAFDFISQQHVPLRVYLVHATDMKKTDSVTLNALDQPGRQRFLATMRPGFEAQLSSETLPQADRQAFEKLQALHRQGNHVTAYIAPRGIGPSAWNQDLRNRTHIRRRFMLLGQTLDGMRVWDVRRAVQAIRAIRPEKNVPIELAARGQMAAVAMYASLFELDIAKLTLSDMPSTHRDGPILLNVSRYLDLPQAVAMAAERCPVEIKCSKPSDWKYPQAVAKQLGWGDDRMQISGSSLISVGD